MRFVALQVTVAALAAACGDPPAGANHDAAVSVPDVSPGVDAPVPDAPPACGSVAVGPGIRPAIASAAGHFAVAYLAVGPALGIAQYTVAGAAAGTATAPIPMFSTVPPAIAARDGAFLVAYVVPDGSVGLAALAPGGALAAPKTIAASQVADLHLAASANDLALTYTEGATARFARVANDGTVLAGPIAAPVAANERIVALAFRTGGWALVAFDAQAATRRLILVDDDGANPTSVALPALVSDMVWTGSELVLTLWELQTGLRLRRLDAAGTSLGADLPLASAVFRPGALAVDAGGYTAAFGDSARKVHRVHATLAGTVDADDILGTSAALLEVTSITVAANGVYAAAWGTEDPAPVEVRFALQCP